MKLMWWDKILLIMTWGKTEEKPNALILWETIYKYTLSRRCSLENWNLCLRDIWPLNLTMHIQGLSNLELLKKILVMYVWLDRRKDKYTHTQACLLIPLRISRDTAMYGLRCIAQRGTFDYQTFLAEGQRKESTILHYPFCVKLSA